MAHQGGKAFGALKTRQEEELSSLNEQYLHSGDWDDVEDLEEKLESYKKQFMEFDENNSGDIDIMELKRMMEKLGQAKTHLELKKMIAEVDTNNSGQSYPCCCCCCCCCCLQCHLQVPFTTTSF